MPLMICDFLLADPEQKLGLHSTIEYYEPSNQHPIYGNVKIHSSQCCSIRSSSN